MKAITLARKPLVGTVAKNVLEYGSGGLNIDSTRIRLNGDYKSKPNGRPSLTGLGDNYDPKLANQPDTVGRFPANLILQHLDGCQCEGVRKVKGQNPKYVSEGKGGPKSVNVFNSYRPAGVGIGHADKDGNEAVANWICEEGCPVRELDAQSVAGGMHSAGSSRDASRSAGKTGMFPMDGDGHRFGDEGGASRFFKHVKS